MTLSQGVGVVCILVAVYCLAKALGWGLEQFGPDARGRRDRYTENANRALVRSRIPYRPHVAVTDAAEQLIRETKTRPTA